MAPGLIVLASFFSSCINLRWMGGRCKAAVVLYGVLSSSLWAAEWSLDQRLEQILVLPHSVDFVQHTQAITWPTQASQAWAMVDNDFVMQSTLGERSRLVAWQQLDLRQLFSQGVQQAQVDLQHLWSPLASQAWSMRSLEQARLSLQQSAKPYVLMSAMSYAFLNEGLTLVLVAQVYPTPRSSRWDPYAEALPLALFSRTLALHLPVSEVADLEKNTQQAMQQLSRRLLSELWQWQQRTRLLS